ncbi:MAG: acyl carrier protein [Acidobacteria bacterium]|nr:MAG: acyl carrier protein [Acidobacteriota bacterium]
MTTGPADGPRRRRNVSIREDVEQFIRDNFFFEGDRLDADASFLETGIIDSTGVLELVAFLEERYGIKVADQDLTPENLDSLARIEAFVEKKRAAAEA